MKVEERIDRRDEVPVEVVRYRCLFVYEPPNDFCYVLDLQVLS